MAANDIKDRDSLRRWLKSRSSDEARVVAVRVAMRATHALREIDFDHRDGDWAACFVLDVFRAHSTAWSAIKYPNHITRAASADAEPLREYPDEVYAGFPGSHASDSAMFATHAAAVEAAHEVFYAAGRAAEEAAAASVAAHKFSVARKIDIDALVPVWVSVRADATRLAVGVTPAELASHPLWPDGASISVQENWNTLKHRLRSRPEEYWEVWIDWYEARLRGEPGNAAEELARIVELAEDEWAAGPAVANKKIKDILARFRNPPPPASINTPTSKTRAHAFVSHAREADGSRASALVSDLEVAGHPCWIAPRDVRSGADWNGAIMSAIDTCDAMILLISDAALNSTFVKAEVQHAFEKGKRVLPVRLTDTAEPGQLDLRLKIVQHIDGRAGDRAVVASILKALS